MVGLTQDGAAVRVVDVDGRQADILVRRPQKTPSVPIPTEWTSTATATTMTIKELAEKYVLTVNSPKFSHFRGEGLIRGWVAYWRIYGKCQTKDKRESKPKRKTTDYFSVLCLD